MYPMSNDVLAGDEPVTDEAQHPSAQGSTDDPPAEAVEVEASAIGPDPGYVRVQIQRSGATSFTDLPYATYVACDKEALHEDLDVALHNVVNADED